MNHLPECENEIMMIIWKKSELDPKGVTCDEIMEKLDKTWTKTTVLNFLTRLCKRGFLECEKQNRINFYSAAVKKEDYLKSESESFFKRMHNSSLSSLITSLYDGKNISKDDLEELKKFIEEAE